MDVRDFREKVKNGQKEWENNEFFKGAWRHKSNVGSSRDLSVHTAMDWVIWYLMVSIKHLKVMSWLTVDFG